MKQALDLHNGREAARTEAPYLSARNRHNAVHACAAMMAGAIIDIRVPRSGDDQYWEAFTGVPAKANQPTTSARTVQSFSDHGLSVVMLGEYNLAKFAEYGPEALPHHVAEHFRAAEPRVLANEQASTGLLVGKFGPQGRGGYEQRPAGLDDVQELHAAGWVVQLTVDGNTLDGRSGVYRPRGLVVVEATDEKVFVHDPGNHNVEGQANRPLLLGELEMAWSESGFALQAIGAVYQRGSQTHDRIGD